ncbi:MAG: PIN domain-containing protein [Deltaproteobacteria bacterium]|nr:PIN domain-containing protein [Deltaproteobacteria bacterium]
MNGYLLDTTAVSILWDARHPDRERINAFLQNISLSPFWISIVVLAEVEYGLKIAPKMDISRQNDVRKEMGQFPFVLDLDKHTVGPYSDLRAALFKKYAPKDPKGRVAKRKRRPEDLVDRTTAKELGVQENDIWIAAQAIQYNLILVTQDRMSRIAEVSSTLSYPLQIAAWK